LIEKIAFPKSVKKQLAPSLFFRWQEQLFSNPVLALETKRPQRKQEDQRIENLEGKLRQKDEVLAELMAEHIALKKEFGEL
jgi:hypothetical protein